MPSTFCLTAFFLSYKTTTDLQSYQGAGPLGIYEYISLFRSLRDPEFVGMVSRL